MEADIRWLDDPKVFRVGQLPAHSDHPIYGDVEEAAEGKSSLVQSLDGNWEFAYSVNAKSRPVDFYRENADSAQFDTIRVPGHIELAGYDQIHYINTMYPWEGKIYRRPAYTLGKGLAEGAFSEAEYNPVGSYRKRFHLAEGPAGKKGDHLFRRCGTGDVCLAEWPFRGICGRQFYSFGIRSDTIY